MLVRKVLRNLQKVQSIHRGFYKRKMKDDNQKKLNLQLEIDTVVFIAHLPILVRRSRSSVRLTGQLAIRCLSANYEMAL